MVDGYLSNGKILYSSPNFSFIFSFKGRELLNLNIDDLIPEPIQTFHKELIENAIKYSNINYIFNTPKDSLLKNNNGEIFKIKLFVKPVPNLSYGLIYYNYIQRYTKSNYIILLDKGFKICGFSEIDKLCSLLNIKNQINSTLIGYHIGFVIPNILMLLEYINGEFNIIKKDFELKGYLYLIHKTNNLKIIIENILNKLRDNKNNRNDFNDVFNEDPKNIVSEFNLLIKELNNQQIMPISIFYKIKKLSFLNGNYEYYEIYINNDIIFKDEFNSLLKSKSMKQNYKKKSNSLKKIIKDKYNDNEYINSTEKYEKEIDEKKFINDDNKTYKNNIISINNEFLYNSNSNNYINFRKIKHNIIVKKDIFQIKIMKYLYYVFGIMIIIIISFHFWLQISSFKKLNKFSEDNLFFNRTKIILGVCYSIIISIRWYSHSLYINNNYSMADNWSRFYQKGLEENIAFLAYQKNISHYLSNEFKPIIKKKFNIELYIYKYNSEKYKYDLDNILLFLINNEIKILQKYSYYSNISECKNISTELGLNEIDLKNLAEVSYFIYYLNFEGYTGENKTKIVNQYFYKFPLTIIFSLLMFICILSLYIYYILYLYKIENIFLNKLIYFNSPNFENYIKKLNEIKKQLINDNNNLNNDEDDEFKYSYSYLKGTNIDEKSEKSQKNKSKQKKDKFILYQYQQKKIRSILKFFFKKNIIFGILILLIMLIVLSYYIITLLLNIKYKNNYLNFDIIINIIENAFKNSFDIYLPIIRELDFYEKHLINCTTLNGFYKMNIPKATDIKIPKIENEIMFIMDDNNLKKETIKKFNLIFNGDICQIAANKEKAKLYCKNFWSGVLLKGMRQALAQIGISIVSVLDELEYLNNINNNKTLFSLMSESTFFDYKIFHEVYLFRAYEKIKNIFLEFREEKLSVIVKLNRFILILYIIITIIISIFFIFFISSFRSTFNSFLNFIGIIPEKYIEEDNNMYKAIINYGQKVF